MDGKVPEGGGGGGRAKAFSTLFVTSVQYQIFTRHRRSSWLRFPSRRPEGQPQGQVRGRSEAFGHLSCCRCGLQGLVTGCHKPAKQRCEKGGKGGNTDVVFGQDGPGWYIDYKPLVKSHKRCELKSPGESLARKRC